jgi:elongation factor Ts
VKVGAAARAFSAARALDCGAGLYGPRSLVQSILRVSIMATATITADQVKQLRDKTGAGMMECKAALSEANGNMEEAITLLRKRGLAQAAKRAGRTTAQGLIGSYIHMGGKIGVLVEVNCESDFVARTESFQNLVKEVAMHIAAADPRWVRREDVSPEAIEKEKSIYRAQMENSGKPANVLDKIIEGKLGSFYSQFVLLDQPFVRDDKMTVSQLVAETSAKTGENITIGRFTRFRVGEGND